MTTQLNQLTELTVTSDDDLILIREDSTGVDKRMRAQNIRAKATTKGDVGLGNVPDLDTTDAVNKAHDQNTDTALAQGTGDQVTASEARSHIDATNNPHGVTKAQVGLSDVPNLDTADAVSKAHDQNTDTALAQGTANEVTAADARAHIDATDNPHGVTKAQVGLSDVPNLDTADAVAKAHDQNTDTKLAEGTPDEVTAADARAHIDATDNPHSVTKAQVGLSNVDNVSAADLRDRSTHTGTQTLATISDAGTIASQNADSVSITGGNIDATIAYDNTSSGLSSTNVQAAIDEVTGLTAATQASAITYDNTASGLVAQDVQAAIDELQSITAAEDAININYDNSASGLVAEDVQAAIDEVQGGLGTAAAANTVDLLNRANHTGTQTLATISDAGTIASQDANDVAITGGNIDATLAYDNTASGLTATNVQAAIDELEARPAVEDADQITYDNTASGLVATDVQAAIDEVQGGLGTIAAQDADDVAITGGTVNADTLQQDGSQAYVRDNILGTVSESSGIPTGAIIQRGSNANGDFVRYADGTQICVTSTQTLNVKSSAEQLGSWPIAFVTGLFRNGNVSTYFTSEEDEEYLRNAVVRTTPTNWSIRNRIISGATTNNQNFAFFCIGRWF